MGIAVNSNQTNRIPEQLSERNKKTKVGLGYQVGDIVSGTVTKVSDQISIQFSEKEASISKSTVPSAKEGDVLNFRVISMSKDGRATLQYLEDQTNAAPMKSSMCTAVLKDMKSMAAQAEAVSTAADEEKLKEIEQSMTEEDYEELSKEGFSLEEYELERFDRALERIKEQRLQIEETTAKRVEDIRKKDDEIKKAGLSKIDDPALRRQAEAMLQAMNLPASAVNINAVAGAVKLASQAVSLSDNAMNYLLQNNLEPTPVNLYTANYSAAQNEAAVSESDWEQVKDQAQALLKKMSETGTVASLEDAKWLFLHDLSIDEQTIAGYMELKDLRDSFSVTETMQAIVKGMAEGNDPIQTVLADKNRSMVQKAVEGFQQISDQAVSTTIFKGEKMNLSNLRKNEEGQNGVPSELSEQAQEIQKELDLVTARRQLEEIRVKLTYDAGMKLAGKGINLHTENLENIVNELRNLEQQYYQKLLNEGGAEVTSSNIAQLSQTLNAADALAQAPEYVLGMRFAERTQVNLETLAADGVSIKEQLSRANESYEQLMTAPRKDMGDSIQKAFAHMDGLLEDLGLELTEANKRAVRILAYNQMEITETSIAQMKEYDAQVTGMIQALQPSMVVELIKDRVNPLNTPVGELREKLKEIANEHGASEEEKYSNYLVKIQKSNTLSEEERDAYIGIYRLLHQVEKSDGKAIGYLVKSEREITLNNLLSAVRTTSGKGINASVNDSFGMSESSGYKKSISRQLDGVFAGADGLAASQRGYQMQLAGKVLDQLSPEFLQYAQEREDLMNCSMERLAELCSQYQAEGNDAGREDYEQIMGQIQQAMGMTDEIRFLKEHHAKVNLKNIQAAGSMLHGSGRVLEQMQSACSPEEKSEINTVLLEAGTYQEFQTEYEKVVNIMELRLREQQNHPTLTIEDMLVLNDTLRNVSYAGNMAKQEYYHIPVQVGERVVGIGLSVQSQGQQKGKMSIHMESETFGEVQADFKMSDAGLKGLIVIENRNAAGSMDHIAESLKMQAQKEAASVQIHVCASNRAVEQYEAEYEPGGSSIQTESLFQIAKAFVRQVKEADY